jgi:hypothetical protein
MEKDTNKKITILPFSYVGAFSDVGTGEIYVGRSFINDNVSYNIAHELSHIISGDSDHNSRFKDQMRFFGYEADESDNLFSRLRARCGIPKTIAANIGNISGIQNVLTDYHLLQAYRKFSQKILGTEGHWEVINEGKSNVTGDSLSAKDQLIRLYPTPKGAFPVVVLYVPVITHFRSPQARMVCYDMMLAEAKIAVGSARRKISGMPTPDGGSISYDGSDLCQEGEKMKEEIIQKALHLGEPDSFWLY